MNIARILTIVDFRIRSTRSVMSQFFVWFGFPVGGVLVYGLLLKQLNAQALSTGVLLLMIWEVCNRVEQEIGAGFLWSRDSKEFLYEEVTPRTWTEWILGGTIYGLFSSVCVSISLLGASIVLGADLTIAGFVPLIILPFVIIQGITLALFVIAVVIRAVYSGDMLAWGVLSFAFPLSGVFFPVSALPRPLEIVGECLPFAHTFGPIREYILG